MRIIVAVVLVMVVLALAACSGDSSVEGELPDLRIANVFIELADDPAFERQFVAAVSNIAAGKATGICAVCRWTCSTAGGGMEAEIVSEGILSGNSTLIFKESIINECESLPAQVEQYANLKIECEVDPDNDIEETNETNNTWSGLVYIPVS